MFNYRNKIIEILIKACYASTSIRNDQGACKMGKILIVDDSSVSRMVIKSRIQALEPTWDVMEASNGDEAILAVQGNNPDYITMDVNMPGMNGFSTVEQIRTFNTVSKIILLTANIQDSSREKAKNLNIHFIAKPVTPLAIKEAVLYFNS
jgi:two-component system, chemotaxis family, chemotaxis protein CheY